MKINFFAHLGSSYNADGIERFFLSPKRFTNFNSWGLIVTINWKILICMKFATECELG